MLRNILGVITGYIAMLAVFVVVTAAGYFAMGGDAAFEPGTFKPSTLWIVYALGMALVAALVAGATCKLIARRRGAVLALAAFALVLGGLAAIGDFAGRSKRDGLARTGTPPLQEVAQKISQPPALIIGNPLMAAIFIPIGGMLVRRKSGEGEIRTPVGPKP